LYDPETGFLRAKVNNRWFGPFFPEEVNFNYTEANAWQYSLFVPQDIEGHIALMGGKENYSNHLDQMFSANSSTSGREQVDITGLIGQYAHGNEPSHHMAYLYNYVNEPWKTQARVRQIMAEQYQNAPDGLSGNEDCGQMSSWFVLSAMGFYSVTPGLDYYTHRDSIV
jgi:predicted alpha-1,2-mannosidase